MVVEDLTTHFFPPKALQLQNIYLLRGMLKHRGTKIRELIYLVK